MEGYNNTNNNNIHFFTAAMGLRIFDFLHLPCASTGMQKRRPTNIKCCGNKYLRASNRVGRRSLNNDQFYDVTMVRFFSFVTIMGWGL